MTERRFIVACTFRDFTGTRNDRIQRAFLESLAAQTHAGIHLAVTLFGEKHVPDVIREYGLDATFFETGTPHKICCTELWTNAASLVKRPDDTVFYTNVDHLFDPDFFVEVERLLPEDGSLISFPHRICESLEDHEKGLRIEDGSGEPAMVRGQAMLPDPSILPPMFRMDPNKWLPDIVAVSGGLIANRTVLERYARWQLVDLWPGIAQSVMLAFLAPPERRLNIVFQRRYDEIVNDYRADAAADKTAETFVEMRKAVFHANKHNMEQIAGYSEEAGLLDQCALSSPMRKIEQMATYTVAGTPQQQKAYAAYLEYWRNIYAAHHSSRNHDDPVFIAEQADLVQAMKGGFD
ncbi:hypothetical protein [Eilatimonas milleporae]|nr:hypothetical protein [Eilatimonas milleporae]